jgi:opacity protein-like surface antigen
MKKLICMLGMGLAITGSAQAQEASTGFTPRAYIGAGVARADHVEGANKNDLKIFGGYEFDKNLGVEAGVSRYRGRDYPYYTWPDGRTESYSTKGYGAYVAGKYTMPIGERFAAYAKLGLAHSERKYSETSGWHYKKSDTDVYAAVGAQAKLTDNVALTLEYEHYGKEKRTGAKNKQWSAGVKYSF